jgi:hypothetical protein
MHPIRLRGHVDLLVAGLTPFGSQSGGARPVAIARVHEPIANPEKRPDAQNRAHELGLVLTTNAHNSSYGTSVLEVNI